MSKFELQSKYKPMGDQPAAIAKLVDGLKNGTKEQTLLGVTGSGKSVVAATTVFVKKNNEISQVLIGEYIDKYFTNYPMSVFRISDTEYINLLDVPVSDQFQTFSFNSVNGKSNWKNVTQISRHVVEKTAHITTTCGRAIETSTDHNFYIAREGKMVLTDASGLQIGDFLPVPRKFYEPEEMLHSVYLPDYIGKTSAFVKIHPNDLLREDVVTSLVASLGKRKFRRIAQRGERVTLHAYSAIQESLITNLAQSKIGVIRQKNQSNIKAFLDERLLLFIGYYIAEGHATDQYLVLSTADEQIVNELQSWCESQELRLKHRPGTYDYVISSVLWSNLLKTWCGNNSHIKHLPSFWTQLSNAQLAILLGAFYSGDGCVEKDVITFTTASEKLASEITYALMRFGIIARIRKKQPAYIGSTTNKAAAPAWIVTIYGNGQINQFTDKIGFTLLRKQKKAEYIKTVKTNSNVDVIPIDAAWLKSTRQALELKQSDLAKSAQISRTIISMYESGKRLPSQNAYLKICTFLLDTALSKNLRKLVVEIKSQIALCELFWTPVKTIQIQKSQSPVPVYDFSVEDNETFFAGRGGLFVHNTFTMANIVQQLQRPTLVMSHNKTLAAQLYNEFKSFFPNNAVHYFVSYFDYYQPEAYIARSDTYIEKDSQINEEIDRLRHAATSSLLSRRDVLIVASVSCIYGIGSVDDYNGMSIAIKAGERKVRDKFLRQLSDIQYQRNDIDFHRSTFRVHGDVVDVFPAGEEVAYRIEFFGDEVDRMTRINPLTGEIEAQLKELKIFPGSHYVTPHDKLKAAVVNIQREMEERVAFFKMNGQLLEAQRLEQRTKYDLEMLEETGFVKGIENYSRYLTNRAPGEQPATLMDYFPDDALMFIDESHMTIPQVRGMYNGDRARKEVLVEHGFRLPSAMDNRPLTFVEFEKHVNQVIYVSATPAEYELSRSPEPVRQVIRPTGLLDPVIEVRPVNGQIDDLIAEIKDTIAKHQRVLVTTLTKRMSEDLTEYLQELDIKVQYLHSDVDTLDRTDILRDLRLGVYDVLVGINLLREGLDLPEVSLVAILDADKEGFLRSEQALIQTVGRAARHIEGRVIMYADRVTGSMQRTIDETSKRREIQDKYNKDHHITPMGVQKSIEKGMRPDLPEEAKTAKLDLNKIPKDEYKHLIKDLSAQMDMAAANLEFEKAAELRDIITDIKAKTTAK